MIPEGADEAPFFALCEWHSGHILIRVVDKSLKYNGKLLSGPNGPIRGSKISRLALPYGTLCIHTSLRYFLTSIVYFYLGFGTKKREKIIKTRRYC